MDFLVNDFISISIDFADKKAAYEIVDTYYAENASLSQYILQYNTVPADIDDTKFVAGLGDTTTDQLGKFKLKSPIHINCHP